MSENLYDGMELLASELDKYIENVGKSMEALESGAKEFVNDLRKLPKPISQIRKSGYTHLVNTFTYRKNKNEIEVVWGKYYGPMVENGTVKMHGKPHLKPLWEQNKEKYYEIITNKIFN